MSQTPLNDGLPAFLARSFRDAGEELYLVGGAVRDALLGRQDLDLDFATSAHPERTVEILEPLALDRPYRVGEKFGTIGIRAGDRQIEITTYRTETYAPGSRKPEVRFGRSLLEDLQRRDFTINAMALDPLEGRRIDPFNGRADLEAGILRAVGAPAGRFEEDPLRLLRAVRFAARFVLAIERDTWYAMTAQASALGEISRERIRDEYEQILTGTDAIRGLTLLRDSGLMEYSVPQLLEINRMPDHGPRHPLSLWEHVMAVVAEVPSDREVRWAALLHDIAKPATRTHGPDGRPRFFHHEELGAELARELLSSLRYSTQVIHDVSLLVETHMQLHAYSDDWSDGAVRRLRMRLGPLLPAAIALARADAAGHAVGERPAHNSPKFDALEHRLEHLNETAGILQSPLSGDDLMARYRLPAGPWIGRVKDALQEEVIEGRLAPDDRDTAWRLADNLVEVDA